MPQPNVSSPGIPPELARHPKYLILRELGRGGMSVVYQARHKEMDRQIVIKVINSALLDQPDTLERFRREIRAAAQLSHPNIVTAYDAEQAGELHMLVMEFVPGQSLAEVLEKKGPFPVEKACQCVSQAALGLHHAYKRNMVHRDIKPSNLMLTPQGRVKILDFGLAKIIRESGTSTGLTPSDIYIGTPEYSAPEQATDMRTADIRADLYSLGCTLYFLLAGRPPFCEESALKTILAHQQKQPQPLPELRPDVPERLWRVVARLLAKEPIRRFQKPKEVVLAMAPFIEPGSKGGAAPAPDVGSPIKGTVIETESEIEKIVQKAPHPTPPKKVPAKIEATSFADRKHLIYAPNEVERFDDEAMPPHLGWWKRPGVLAGAFGLSLGLILMTVILIAAGRQPPDNEKSKARASNIAAVRGQDGLSSNHEKGFEAPPPEPKWKPGEPESIKKERDPEPPIVAEVPPTKDNEDETKTTTLRPGPLRLKLPDPPARVNDEAKSEIGKDKAEDTRSPEGKELPTKDYKTSCEAARTKLLKEFDTVIAELRKRNDSVEEKLKRIDLVKREKERFENRGLIPWSERMRPHVDRYLASLGRAQENLRAAYEPQIDKALRAGNDKEVDRLRAEWKRRLDVKVMARWRHFAIGRGSLIVTLYSNGSINNSDVIVPRPQINDIWNYDFKDDVLSFRWCAPDRPGGVLTAKLRVSPDGKTYAGTNDDKPERRPKLTGDYVLPGDQTNEAKPPPDGNTQRGKRQLRWSMQFQVNNSSEKYVAQLQALGAILAIPVGKRANVTEYGIVRDLSARPVKLLEEDIKEIKRLVCWRDDKPDSVKGVISVLRLRLHPDHFLAFLPEEEEQKLLRLELDYLKERHPGRTEDDISLTKFRFKTGNGKYILEVVEQKLK
jgi:tRNA A-37 threonylcarbamoyl transferase component Bud32